MSETHEEAIEAPAKMPSISSLLHFLWLKKWVILSIWLALAVPAGIALSIFNLPKTYSAGTVLRFPSVIGAQTNVMRDVAITHGESIITVFNSFQVMEATIRKLSLRWRIATPEMFEKKVFKSVRYSDNLGLGRYTLVIGKYPWASLLYIPQGSSDQYTLFQGALKPGNVLATPGLELALTDSLARNSEGLAFDIKFISMERTAKELKKKLTTRSLGSSNVEIRLDDRDPWLVADILNSLREEFLKVYYGTTEVQDVGILVQMEKDLEIAKEKLERSQDELSSYYASHPELMQTPGGTSGDNLTYLEARQDMETVQRNLKRVQSTFQAKPVNGTPEQLYFWCMELLGAMAEAGEAKANIQRSSLQELQQRQATMRATMGPEHPHILEMDAQKNELFTQIEGTYNTLNRRLSQESADLKQKMAANAPFQQSSISVKVKLELDRLNSVNKNNQEIYQGLQDSYNRAKLVTGSEFFKVTVVDPARPAIYEPPSLQSRLIVASLAVVLLALIIPAFFSAWPMLFKRIWTGEDVRRLMGTKLLGSIGWNALSSRSEKPAGTGANPPDPLLLFFGSAYSIQDLEAYRVIREETESHFRHGKTGKLCLLVTSTRPNEGKSLTACNLAMTFARKGKRTLLIDADFRLGRVDKIFNIPVSTGVDDLLSQPDMTDSQFLQNVSLCFQPTVQRNLVIAPRSRSNPNAGEMVSSDRFKSFIILAKEQFDVVIIDTPPILITPEPLALVEVVDGILFVCLSGGTVAADAAEAVGILQERGVKVATILNGMRDSPFARNHYKKYSYYYQAQTAASGQESG